MKLSPFLKEHKKHLKTLTRKQLIEQVLIGIDISAHMEAQFNDTYEDLDNKYQICEAELIKTEKELEETQEALRRNRNQLESYKNMEEELSLYKILADKLDESIKVRSDLISLYENMSVWNFIIKKFK